MSIIDGGKLVDNIWQKLSVILLTGCIGLGSWFANRLVDTIEKLSDTVAIIGDSVIKHDVEIANMKEHIKEMQGDRRFYLQPAPNNGFQFRGRVRGGMDIDGRPPKDNVPRPPHDPPTVPETPRAPEPPKQRDKNEPPDEQLPAAES